MKTSSRLHINLATQQAIGDFKRFIKKEIPSPLVEFKLFGSRARGTAHADSDVDVLVVFERNINRSYKRKIVDFSADLISEYEITVSPHIFSQRELEDLRTLPTSFTTSLEREAIAL